MELEHPHESIWRALNPDCSLTTDRPLKASKISTLLEKDLAEQLELSKKDGYFNMSSLLKESDMDQLMHCVKKVMEMGYPPVYSFVYDEFWQVVLNLTPLLNHFVGENFLVLPEVWVWYIDHQNQGYFRPHRDLSDEQFIDENGLPSLLSVWIPLDDVSPNQSCIYVLPASWDPEYPDEVVSSKRRLVEGEVQSWDVKDLVNIRALPAKKGSVLGWNGGVLHWGSKPSSFADARCSVGLMFQSINSPLVKELTIDLAKPLSLDQRYGAIFDTLRLYGKAVPNSSSPSDDAL